MLKIKDIREIQEDYFKKTNREIVISFEKPLKKGHFIISEKEIE